jgi:hypothetical protein
MSPRQFVLATAAQRRSTLRVTTAVTSTGRAVDQALVGVGRLNTAYPARVFVAPLGGAAEVQHSIADRGVAGRLARERAALLQFAVNKCPSRHKTEYTSRAEKRSAHSQARRFAASRPTKL